MLEEVDSDRKRLIFFRIISLFQGVDILIYINLFCLQINSSNLQEIEHAIEFLGTISR